MKLADENHKISLAELRKMSQKMSGAMVKAVVDLEKEILMVDAELHVDLEAELLKQGSQLKDLWGINFYPEITDDNWLEFDSMINIRPWQGNRSRGVEDENVRKRILAVVDKLVEK